MARRLALVLLAAAAVLTAALGAAVIWREPLAQSLLDRAVEDLDIPGARLTVERVAVDRLRLTDLAAGDEDELTIGSVEVDFDLLKIVRGRIDKVAVGGLTLNLDLREGAAPLGSLQPLVDRARNGGAQATGAGRLPADLPDVELRASRLEAETPFGPANLALDGTFAADGGDGPRLDLTGQLSSDWARLVAALSASGDPQESAEARLAISDGAIELPDGLLRVRKLTGDLDVRVEGGRPQSGRGELAADGLAVAGTPFDRAYASFELSRDQAALTAALESDDGSFALSLDGRAEALDTRPQVTLGLRSEIGETAPVWALSRPPFPTGGTGRIELEAVGDFPVLPRLPAEAAALGSWLAGSALSGTATGGFSRLSLSDSGAEAVAGVDLDAQWAAGELRLTTRGENRMTASGLTVNDLTAFELPAAVADEVIRLTGGTLALSLPAPSQPPAALTWRRDNPGPHARFDGSAVVTAGPLVATLIGEAEADLRPGPSLARADLRVIAISARDLAIRGQGIEELEVTGSFAGTPLSFAAAGEASGRLAAPALNGLSAERLSLRLPFRVSRDAGAIDLRIARPGRITLYGLGAADRLTSEGTLEVTLAGGEAGLTLPGEDGRFALAHDARLAVGPTRLHWQSDDGSRIPFELGLPDLTIAGELAAGGRYRGRAAVKNAAVTLPDSGLAFEGLSADLELPGEPGRAAAAFEIAAFRHLASPAAFAPLRLSGRGERRGGTLELVAEVLGLDGERLAEVAATHDLAAGSGRADVILLPLRFQPGGLQPAALLPLFAAISDARGGAEGAAALAWDRDGVAATAHLVIEDLSFSRDATRVEGLDLDLRLDSLQPPASPPHQKLSADLVDIGVPLTDLVARFRLLADSPGQVLLEEASFATVGSRVTLRDTLIDPLSERFETRLLVHELDVGVLFEVLAVDGLSGSGELAGTIPVTRDGDRVIIEDARLTADGPGVLRFRSDAAARALAGGGEHADLVIKALQNFHYQALTLTGNLDRDGEARLRLEILGNNPDVLEGYPFQLNINLTGNPAPILEVLQLSRTLIKDILERARRLSR